jgi:hypothetical protein
MCVVLHFGELANFRTERKKGDGRTATTWSAREQSDSPTLYGKRKVLISVQTPLAVLLRHPHGMLLPRQSFAAGPHQATGCEVHTPCLPAYRQKTWRAGAGDGPQLAAVF